MSAGHSIKIDALHSVRVEKTASAVKIAFIVGGVPMFSRAITPTAARHLGDALGYASNDVAEACAVRQDSTWPRNCATCELRTTRGAA